MRYLPTVSMLATVDAGQVRPFMKKQLRVPSTIDKYVTQASTILEYPLPHC